MTAEQLRQLADEMREFIRKGFEAKHGRTFVAHRLLSLVDAWAKEHADADV